MTSTEQFVKTQKCTNDVAERGNTIIRMMMIKYRLQICKCQVSHRLHAGADQGQQNEAEDLVVEWDGRNNAGVDFTTITLDTGTASVSKARPGSQIANERDD